MVGPVAAGDKQGDHENMTIPQVVDYVRRCSANELAELKRALEAQIAVCDFPMTSAQIAIAARTCPRCHAPTFVVGHGSTIDVRAIADPDEHGNGAKSRYRCRACGHTWIL